VLGSLVLGCSGLEERKRYQLARRATRRRSLYQSSRRCVVIDLFVAPPPPPLPPVATHTEKRHYWMAFPMPCSGI